MTLTRRLVVLVAIFAAGLLIAGIFNSLTLGQVKVNGPLYARIVQQKDLLADILPPPEYLLESYLVSQQLAVADKGEIPGLVEKSQALNFPRVRRRTSCSARPMRPARHSSTSSRTSSFRRFDVATRRPSTPPGRR